MTQRRLCFGIFQGSLPELTDAKPKSITWKLSIGNALKRDILETAGIPCHSRVCKTMPFFHSPMLTKYITYTYCISLNYRRKTGQAFKEKALISIYYIQIHVLATRRSLAPVPGFSLFFNYSSGTSVPNLVNIP